MLDTYKYKGRIKCPVCGKDAPSVGLCSHCGCSTDCRTSQATGGVEASGLKRDGKWGVYDELQRQSWIHRDNLMTAEYEDEFGEKTFDSIECVGKVE